MRTVLTGFALTITLALQLPDVSLTKSRYSLIAASDCSAASNNPVSIFYRDSYETTYQFTSDDNNGYIPADPGPAWYAGGGEGNTSAIGKSWIYFNQYAYKDENGFHATAAPVNQFFSSEIKNSGIAVPDDVSSVVYDGNGNSIWFRLISCSTEAAAAKTIKFAGVADVIGGTGKFEGATGKVIQTGYFNTADRHANIVSEGTISY
jgi:hypothetical protein